MIFSRHTLSDLLKTLRKPQESSYELAAAGDGEFDGRPIHGHAHPQKRSFITFQKSRILRVGALCVPLGILAGFGMLHIIVVISGQISFSGRTRTRGSTFGLDRSNDATLERLTRFQNDTQDIVPIPCHSHNDYWRNLPFYDAIHAGCTSFEADIWLSPDQTELYIGHNKASLTTDRTLEALYLGPITALLDNLWKSRESPPSASGIFQRVPEQTTVLLLDFKSDGDLLLPVVLDHLDRLRRSDRLSFHNSKHFVSRAITVVATGNIPQDLNIGPSEDHVIFVDAQLAELMEFPTRSGSNSAVSFNARQTSEGSISTLQQTLSYYASTSFRKTVGYPWRGRLSAKQLQVIRTQIKAAHGKGMKVRYWDTPEWPASMRNHIWQVLLDEGVDVLNVDDLHAAAALDWRYVQHGWIDG